MDSIGPQSTYRLLWEDVITAIAKAKAVLAATRLTTASASEGMSDSLNYGAFGFRFFLDIPYQAMVQISSLSHTKISQMAPSERSGHLAF